MKFALAVILVGGRLMLARGGFSTRTPATAPALRFILSVDWEGRTLAEENLAAIEAFRVSFPELKLTQFLNAAYFTKRGASAELARSQIRRGIRPEDELALHIHAWRSLVEAAGAGYRDQPTFWGGPAGWPDDTGDVGHEVELPAYSLEELRAVCVSATSCPPAPGNRPPGAPADRG